MAGVFVSYRREDSAGWAGRICDHSQARLGADRVFMDIDDIPIGSDFTQVIDETLAQVDAVVVVIGRRWLAGTDAHGGRRIDGPADFVHREVRAALERDITVIPVLMALQA